MQSDLDAGARIVCETVETYDPATLSDVRVIADSPDDTTTVQWVVASIR